MLASFKFVRTYLLACILAAVYIQITSILPPSQTFTELMAFTLGSVLLKALLHFILMRHMKHRTKTAPTIVYFVLIPPAVLVETQMRVAFLRFQASQDASWLTDSKRTAQVYLFGALGAVELVVRGAKLLLLRRRVRGRHSRRPAIIQVLPSRLIGFRSVGESREGELFLFGASTLAEMMAEYAAIFGSSCVFVFYRNHPKYSMFHPTSGTASGQGFKVDVAVDFLLTIVVQVVTELAVDLLCCGIEVAHGVSMIPPTPELQRAVRYAFVGRGMSNTALCAIGYVGTSS